MKNQKDIEIKYVDCDYKCTNFLKNGDLVTFMKDSDLSIYPTISIYTLSNKNKWTRKDAYELNQMNITFGDFIDDKMWMLTNDLILLLDLSTFQLTKLKPFVGIFFIMQINQINNINN